MKTIKTLSFLILSLIAMLNVSVTRADDPPPSQVDLRIQRVIERGNTAQIFVENKGHQKSKRCFLDVFMIGPRGERIRLGRVVVGEVAPCCNLVVTITAKGIGDKETATEYVVDSTNAVAEFDETNNSHTVPK